MLRGFLCLQFLPYWCRLHGTNSDWCKDGVSYRLPGPMEFGLTIHLYYYSNIPFLYHFTSKKETQWGQSQRQEPRTVNYIFYCYVLPITANSISSVHFNLHKNIVKQIEQRVTYAHDDPVRQCMESTGVLIQYMEDLCNNSCLRLRDCQSNIYSYSIYHYKLSIALAAEFIGSK